MAKTKKIYIVTGRYGTEMFEPEVFFTKKKAEEYARERIMDAARDAYGSNARRSTLNKWAEENGYDFNDYYFWDGGYDATEMSIAERTIEI